MDVEHNLRLSWFGGDESHEQDGERLRGPAASARTNRHSVTASGDPAMAFAPFGCRAPARPNGGIGRRLRSECTMHPLEFAHTRNNQRRIPSFSISVL
jgi:hypothetical protein